MKLFARTQARGIGQAGAASPADGQDVAAEEDISPAVLYHWRQQTRLNGGLFPDDGADPESWTAREKFTAVMETAPLDESERAEYCRKRGLYL